MFTFFNLYAYNFIISNETTIKILDHPVRNFIIYLCVVAYLIAKINIYWDITKNVKIGSMIICQI